MPEFPEFHKDQIGSKCSHPLISDYVITSYFVQTISIGWKPRYYNGGDCMEWWRGALFGFISENQCESEWSEGKCF